MGSPSFCPCDPSYCLWSPYWAQVLPYRPPSPTTMGAIVTPLRRRGN